MQTKRDLHRELAEHTAQLASDLTAPAIEELTEDELLAVSGGTFTDSDFCG